MADLHAGLIFSKSSLDSCKIYSLLGLGLPAPPLWSCFVLFESNKFSSNFHLSPFLNSLLMRETKIPDLPRVRWWMVVAPQGSPKVSPNASFLTFNPLIREKMSPFLHPSTASSKCLFLSPWGKPHTSLN